jgi:hypothetical protein
MFHLRASTFLTYAWDHSLGRVVAGIVQISLKQYQHPEKHDTALQVLPTFPSFARGSDPSSPWTRAWLFDTKQQKLVADSGLITLCEPHRKKLDDVVFHAYCQRLNTSPHWKHQIITLFHGDASTDTEPFPHSFVCGRANYHHINPAFTLASSASTLPEHVDECARVDYDKMFSLVYEMRQLLQDEFPVEDCDCTLVPIPATFFAPTTTHTDPDALALEWLLLDDLLAGRPSPLLLHEDEREAIQARAASIRAQMETMIAEQLEIHANVVQRAQERGGGTASASASIQHSVSKVSSASASASASSANIDDTRLTRKLEQLLAEKRIKYRRVRTMLHALLRKVDWRTIGSGGGSHQVFHLTDASSSAPLTVVKPHGGQVDLPTRHIADVFRTLMRCIHQGFEASSSTSLAQVQA